MRTFFPGKAKWLTKVILHCQVEKGLEKAEVQWRDTEATKSPLEASSHYYYQETEAHFLAFLPGHLKLKLTPLDTTYCFYSFFKIYSKFREIEFKSVDTNLQCSPPPEGPGLS